MASLFPHLGQNTFVTLEEFKKAESDFWDNMEDVLEGVIKECQDIVRGLEGDS